MVIYSMDVNAAAPVFYPVVPDSFSTRESADHGGNTQRVIAGGWIDETDTPFLAPQDPWSF